MKRRSHICRIPGIVVGEKGPCARVSSLRAALSSRLKAVLRPLGASRAAGVNSGYAGAAAVCGSPGSPGSRAALLIAVVMLLGAGAVALPVGAWGAQLQEASIPTLAVGERPSPCEVPADGSILEIDSGLSTSYTDQWTLVSFTAGADGNYAFSAVPSRLAAGEGPYCFVSSSREFVDSVAEVIALDSGSVMLGKRMSKGEKAFFAISPVDAGCLDVAIRSYGESRPLLPGEEISPYPDFYNSENVAAKSCLVDGALVHGWGLKNCDGAPLVEGADYKVARVLEYSSWRPVALPDSEGEYLLEVEGLGKYEGQVVRIPFLMTTADRMDEFYYRFDEGFDNMDIGALGASMAIPYMAAEDGVYSVSTSGNLMRTTIYADSSLREPIAEFPYGAHELTLSAGEVVYVELIGDLDAQQSGLCRFRVDLLRPIATDITGLDEVGVNLPYAPRLDVRARFSYTADAPEACGFNWRELRKYVDIEFEVARPDGTSARVWPTESQDGELTCIWLEPGDRLDFVMRPLANGDGDRNAAPLSLSMKMYPHMENSLSMCGAESLYPVLLDQDVCETWESFTVLTHFPSSDQLQSGRDYIVDHYIDESGVAKKLVDAPGRWTAVLKGVGLYRGYCSVDFACSAIGKVELGKPCDGPKEFIDLLSDGERERVYRIDMADDGRKPSVVLGFGDSSSRVEPLEVVQNGSVASYYYTVPRGERAYLAIKSGSPAAPKPYVVNLVESPKIVTQPEDCVVADGGTLSFAVEASDAAAYEWQYGTDGKTFWTVNSPSSSRSVLEMKMAKWLDGRWFRCAVTGYDGSVVYTEPVKASYRAGKPIIDVQPTECRLVPGSDFELAIDARNVASYEWQYGTDGEAFWIVDSPTAVEPRLTMGYGRWLAGRWFRCKLVGYDGSVTYSKPVRAELGGGSPVIVSAPSDCAAGLGEDFSLSVEAENAALYEWQYGVDGKDFWTVNAPSHATGRLTMPMSEWVSGRWFRCKVTGYDGSVVYTDPVRVRAV